MGTYSTSVDEHLVLPARVSVPSAERKLSGRTSSEPQNFKLVIDTGSRRTSLSPSVLHRVNPLALRFPVRVETSLAAGVANLLWVRFEFPEAGIQEIPAILVASLPLPRSLRHFDGVLGRDVLRRWERVVYFGRRGRLTVQDQPSWLTRWRRR